jgi:hypothetical protein
MTTQKDFSSPQQIRVELEIVAENPSEPDPGAMSEVEQNVEDALKKDGYTIEPVYTAEKGGFLLLMIPAIHLLAQIVWMHKDQLMELLKVALPVVQYVLKERDKRAANNKQIMKVTIEIDGAPIQIEGSDLESVSKLADKFRTSHPQVAEKVTLQSTVKVQGIVPKRQTRLRR